MAIIDKAHREMMMKVVYYGPALAGKTTNLKSLHALAPPGRAGRLMNLEPQGDSTVFFHLLPVRLATDSGVVIKLKILTVPVQPLHWSTQRILLRDADAVVFVADSQKEATAENKASFGDLRAHLDQLGMLRRISLVLQFNKQDLPCVRSPEELAKFGERVSSPVVLAQAIHGLGVIESLQMALAGAWDTLDALHGVARRLQCSQADYDSALCRDWLSPLSMREASL